MKEQYLETFTSYLWMIFRLLALVADHSLPILPTASHASMCRSPAADQQDQPNHHPTRWAWCQPHLELEPCQQLHLGSRL